ncbi:chemotaxis protein CheW [Heyndrickxia sporothermodurans]
MEMGQYLEIFIEESKEHLQSCNEQLLLLEKNPHDLSIVNEIFRSAHTLKGMSATMGYEDLANLTHKMENVLDAIRNEKIVVTPEILDIVFLAVDDLETMVESIASGGDGKKDVSDVIEKLHKIEAGDSMEIHSAANEVAASIETVEKQALNNSYDQYEQTIIQQSLDQGFHCFELSISLRSDCLLKAARVFMTFEVLEKCGEIIKSYPSVDQLEAEQFDSQFSVTLITHDHPDEIKKKIMKVSEIEEVIIVGINNIQQMHDDIAEEKKSNHKEAIESQPKTVKTSSKKQEKNENTAVHSTAQSKTIRVNIDRLDILMNLFEELVIDRGRLEQISKELHHTELDETVERMTRISSDLQNIILNMRMVPVETVFNRFPRMVRQLARDLHKKINLEVIGAETELDRTVIDEIGDPLVHLLRNAIDHGIEMPEKRISQGKQEEGTIKLKAYHSGNHVFIEIEDDGAGINRDKVLDKALSKGIVTEEEAESLSDKQVYELILASGFSTADTISDISGRGVGLDVVKSTIESLGGTITIESNEGQGSVFIIQLPLTLSIIAVMLVEIGQEKYAVPLSSIIETAIIKQNDILNAHNQKVIDFRGNIVPLVFLKEVFNVPNASSENEYYSIVIVRKGSKMAALVVDSFIGQQEIVLKSLGNYLTNVFAISGATILGDGQVALIIDCNALIK